MYQFLKFSKFAFVIPPGYQQHSRGYTRVSLVDGSVGSVHSGLGICHLDPDGWVEPCVQATEKGIYLLHGEIEILKGKEAFRLVTDDYALIPYGDAHAFRNTGNAAARWLEMQAPQPKPPGGWQDTFFTGKAGWPPNIIIPDLGDPRTRHLGHFQEGRARIGINGLTVYRFIEEELGSHHFYMMRGELAVGGTVGTHDHPVEETYFTLSGEADMEIEGKPYHLQPGDMAWTGVGASHAFRQRGDVPWRWIETQAPQFPSQHGSRKYAVWDKLHSTFQNSA